ncbi:DUF6049 family protein [Cellulomonas iranensis]|uniref:DUF6049 family protein n=1 Tax=Cellulomonas iranensis TaxID=76862 RepID=UPI0023F1FA32|nr:DUF6049 family protein [Cellulomonas iranensis]
MSAARRAVPTLLATLLVLLALVTPAAASATPAPSPTTSRGSSTPAADLDPVRVQITQVTPNVLRPGDDLVVQARLTNTTDEEITNLRARVRLERIRPGSRADLATWLEPGTADARARVGTVVATVALEEPLAPGASADVEARVPADGVGLLDRPDTWGPRGLAVEATGGRSARLGLQRTFALWATEGDVAQARLSVLAPVVGPAPVPAGVDVTAPEPALDELVRGGGRLAAVLDLTRRHPDVALAVDPALLTAARAESGPVATWADALVAASSGRDVVALPWSDPDLVALAHADQPDLLTAAVDASARAAATDVTDGSPFAARTDVLWAPGPTTDRATVDLAAAAGASTLVLAPGDLMTDVDAAGARTVLPTDDGTVTGLVPDATLTTLLVDPTSLDPAATRATVVQRVLAELAVLARASTDGPQHVLVALPRTATPDVALVDAALTAVQGAPWSRSAPLTALLGATDAAAPRDTLPAQTDVPAALAPAQVTRLADARSATVAFAGVTDDPATVLRGVDAEVLAPLATAWRADPDARARLVDAVVADVDARRTGLTLAPTSTQNLISADSEVRFSVRNELPAAASVRVQVTPRKACLDVDPSDVVVVPAGSDEVVPVAVHAIANCEVVVEAVLTGADGTALAAPVTFVVRASPTIESVGTLVVGALLAVGLVLGVVRTVRRGQSARRGAHRVEGEEGTRPLPVLGGAPEEDQ